jgi:alkylation response protein AidB-like acyl-CoA dehydrogenase
LEEKNQFPTELWKKACHLGFKGIDFPEKYGGQGYDFIEKLIVLAEFCRVDSSLGVSLGLADIGSRMILKLEDDDRKRKLLGPMTRGESISAIAMEIPGKNQKNPFTIGRKANKYIINGKKEFVVNGGIADTILITFESREGDPDGWCSLVLGRDQKGLLRQGVANPLGLKTCSLGNLIFDSLEVNASLNQPHSSEKVFEFSNERKIETSVQAIGIAQNVFTKALHYSKQRVQFKRKIIEFQGIQLMLADDAIQIEAARALIFRFFDFFMNPIRSLEKFTLLANLIKTFCTDTSVRVALDAIRIFGGYGVTKDYHVERAFRDAKVLQNLEGNFLEDKSFIALKLAI